MRRVLLVTIQNNSNFGNRLQNYALQRIINDLGFQVDCLNLKGVPLADMKITVTQQCKGVLRKMASIVLPRYKRGVSVWTRRLRCAQFSKKYIHHYLLLSRKSVLTYDFGEYDAVVAGSDQIWHNWKRIEDELSFYYLEFIEPARRIAYAPSFGFEQFPEADREIHKRGLLGMRVLSCREQEGCDLIYRLTERKAKKVLDPTLLLTGEEWADIEKKPAFLKENTYLLQFMLGIVSEEYEKEISQIAEKRKATIIDINDLNRFDRYGISPAEFIWLIHHADAVCTDSFHAAVFSILFEKELCVFKRNAPGFEHMFGRLNDLLSSLHLDGVVYLSAGKEPMNMNTRLSHEARSFMESEKENSIQYLRDALADVAFV